MECKRSRFGEEKASSETKCYATLSTIEMVGIPNLSLFYLI